MWGEQRTTEEGHWIWQRVTRRCGMSSIQRHFDKLCGDGGDDDKDSHRIVRCSPHQPQLCHSKMTSNSNNNHSYRRRRCHHQSARKLLLWSALLVSGCNAFPNARFPQRWHQEGVPSDQMPAGRSASSVAPAQEQRPPTQLSLGLGDPTSAIDPLLVAELESGDQSHHINGIFHTSQGFGVWRSALLKGRLASAEDFETANCEPWPSNQVLLSKLSDAMVATQLPRFVHRHPETISIVLRFMLQLTAKFDDELEFLEDQFLQDSAPDDADANEEFDEVDCHEDEPYWYDADSSSQERHERAVEDLYEDIGESLRMEFVEAFSGVISGVGMLDALLGFEHGLLDVHQGAGMEDDENSQQSSSFGFENGVWSHSGWTVLRDLQQHVSDMPELTDLMKELGRRPTAEQSTSIERFAPRRLNSNGEMGAQFDSQMRDSVSGITRSGSLTEMLPSESILLKGSPALRRLFMSKKAEGKLLSYEMSGWKDVPSIPKRKSRHSRRMPSAAGGPIIVCLDTSWSMSGIRERLSKAVVLECVSTASKQGRDCHVVAFSSTQSVMESEIISADPEGITRLLDFLSYSFGGGTDVTGALKFAMGLVRGNTGGDDDVAAGDGEYDMMSSSDLLLITDGEIPDPPVPRDVMERLDALKDTSSVQIHGLLVGKRESVPLEKLCTHIHDFLVDHETVIPSLARGSRSSSTMSQRGRAATSPSTRLAATHSSSSGRGTFNGRSRSSRPSTSTHLAGFVPRSRPFIWSSTSLPARYNDYDDGDGDGDGGGRGKRTKKKKQNAGSRSRKNWDGDGDDYDGDFDAYDGYTDDGIGQAYGAQDDDVNVSIDGGGDRDSLDANRGGDISAQPPSGSDDGEPAAAILQTQIGATIKKSEWSSNTLDDEVSRSGISHEQRHQIQRAIALIGKGLIERQEEARLVVLAAIASEHILLLGCPGTAKSQLGRRLSHLFDGFFFQRLLTRFTTPEEIFGPLSLKALENDEYRRKTDGFLPTAAVAFLDEIFKANSAILNTLLTILNERRFDNGEQVDCPIRCVVGASNELPESDELDALYDRFLLRKEVLPVSDEGILQLLAMSNPDMTSACDDSDEDCQLALRSGSIVDSGSGRTDAGTGTGAGVDNNHVSSPGGIESVVSSVEAALGDVTLPTDVALLIRDLRNHLQTLHDIEISDRRIVKAGRLLKIAALCDRRQQIDLTDCLLLEHVLWQHPNERGIIREWIWDNLTPCRSTPMSSVNDEGSTGVNGASAVARNAGAQSSPSLPVSTAPSNELASFRILLELLQSEAIGMLRKTSGRIRDVSPSDATALNRVRADIATLVGTLTQKRNAALRYAEVLRRLADGSSSSSQASPSTTPTAAAGTAAMLEPEVQQHDGPLWMDDDTALSMRQLLLPKAMDSIEELTRSLTDAVGLQLLLTVDINVGSINGDVGSGGDDATALLHESRIDDEDRLSMVQDLWDADSNLPEVRFTEDELGVSMREAKAKYDLETFRKWKRANKKRKSNRNSNS